MALTDVDISKPSAARVGADQVKRVGHPAAPFLPVISALLLVAALAANVFSLVTPSWLKTTAYPTLFNVNGKIEPGVNGSVTTRLGATEMCFFIANATPPATVHNYCVDYHTKYTTPSGVDMTACEFAHAKDALLSVGMSWDSHEAEFLREVCGGLGDATIVLQMAAIAAAGVALLAVLLSCVSRGRVGKVLRIVCVVAALLSGALALTTYMIWLTKLSWGPMEHGKCAVLTAGSMFLLGGAALASSSGLEIFATTPPPVSTEDGAKDAKDAPETDGLPLANAA